MLRLNKLNNVYLYNENIYWFVLFFTDTIGSKLLNVSSTEVDMTSLHTNRHVPTCTMEMMSGWVKSGEDETSG